MIHIHGLFLAVKIGVEIVAKRTARIVKSQFLVNTLDLLDILGRELEIAFQVGLYAGWSLRFWEDGVALCDSPRESDLRAGLVVFLADLDEDWIILQSPQLALL